MWFLVSEDLGSYEYPKFAERHPLVRSPYHASEASDNRNLLTKRLLHLVCSAAPLQSSDVNTQKVE